MIKKRFLIFGVLSLTIFLILGVYVFAGCCFNNDNFCQDVTEAECCPDTGGVCSPGLYNLTHSCGDTMCENYGCCFESCTYIPYKSCSPSSGFDDWNYNCENPVPDECQTGCCVYLESGVISLCDDDNGQGKYQKDCVEYSPYDEVIFYEGYIGSECDDICGYEQTLTGNVSGYVSLEDGTMLFEAYVILEDGKADYTDETGYYKIEDATTGTQTITVSYEGYESVSDTVTVSEGVTVTKDLVLTTPTTTGSLQGYIWNITAGRPVEGAYVYWSGGGGYTDESGAYTINDIYNGDQQITAISSGFDTEIDIIDIIAGEVNYLNFTLYASEGLEQDCGNEVIEGSEECDDGNTEDYDGCNSNCEVEICGLDEDGNVGYCCEFDYLCLGDFLTGITGCGVDYYGCCDISCLEIPECYNGIDDDLDISNTDFSSVGHAGPDCECGQGQYYNTIDSTEGEGYCCGSVFSYNPCSGEVGRLYGFVRNSDGEGMNDVVVSIELVDSDVTRSEGSPPEDGYYVMDLPARTYNVTFSKEGYTTQVIENVEIISGQETQLDVELELISTECTGNIPAPVLNIDNVKGTTKLNISWEQQCKDEEAISYLIFFLFRDGKPIGGGFSRDENHYVDDGSDLLEEELQWDTEYEYTLNVTTKMFGSNKATESHNTGKELCKDKFGDEEICLNDDLMDITPKTIRVNCDENNQPSEIEDCYLSQGPDSLCIGPVNNKTACRMSSDCRNLGNPENIFGLYYDSYYTSDSTTQSCLLNDITNVSDRNYCYYDYSSTTIDECTDCDQEGICFDYGSSSACEVDNCYYGPTNYGECIWEEGYYYELGKGICYVEDYVGTDYCDMCNAENIIFENLGCTTSFCKLLGSCYSEGNKCEPCTVSTTCEEYVDEEGCIGSSEFNIPSTICPYGNSSSEFDNSDDSCNLKKCKWVNNECIKDADDDDVADCGSYDTDCQRDVTSPAMIITEKPTVITSKGVNLVFEIYDNNDVDESYYCIAKDVCCPTEEIVNNEIVLPNDNFLDLFDIEGNYNISFYSVDEYDNVGKIKTETLFFDTKAPTIYIREEVTGHPGSENTSDITINISVTEYSLCSDYILGATDLENKVTDEYIVDSHKIVYEDVSDGTYYYSVTCSDIYGNENEVVEWFLIDTVNNIKNEAPSGETIADSRVSLHLETTDQIYCVYEKEEGIWTGFNPGVFQGEGVIYPEGCDVYTEQCTYFHNSTEDFESGTYNIDVECWSQPNRQGNPIDSTNLLFTVDTTAPDTTALYEYYTENYNKVNEDSYYNNPTIKLNCSDPGFGPPDEFGCKDGSTEYCIETFDCVPDTVYSIPFEMFNSYSTGDYRLCFNSEDNGDNQEETKCISVKIDTASPTIAISTPSDNYVTNQETITVSGSWEDSSGVEVKVEWWNETEKIVVLADTTGTAEGEFSTSIDLFKGENTVNAVAEDSAEPDENKNENSITVYYDLRGPAISNAAVYSSTDRIDSDCYWCDDGEYGQDIKLNLTAKDEEWCYTYDCGGDDIQTVEVEIKCTSDSCSSFGTDGVLIDSMDSIGSNDYEMILSGVPIGDYNLTYYAEDFFGNPNRYYLEFSVIDTTPAEISITIMKNEEIVDRVSYGTYDVYITSNEELSSIELDYRFNGKTKDVLSITGEGTEFTGIMEILTEDTDYVNVDQEAIFSVDAYDAQNFLSNEIIAGAEFTIDTQGPSEPSVYDPVSTKEYSNENLAYITGSAFAYEEGLNITIWKNTVSSEITDPNWQQVDSGLSSTASSYITWSSADYGDFEILDEDTIRINDFSELFNVDKYFEFEQSERYNKAFYDITSVEFYSSVGSAEYYDITFSPALDNIGMSTNQNINIYDGDAPAGWFDFFVELDEGNNYIYIQGVDDLGNKGDISNIYEIIYDYSEPNIEKVSPLGSKTKEASPEIKIKITDESSIDRDSIIFTIDGTEYNCDYWISCAPYVDEEKQYNITYTPSADLDQGMHTITVTVNDFSLNSKTDSWDFDVDSSVPTQPEIEVIDGIKTTEGSPYTWYKNDASLEINVNFPSDEDISMKSIKLIDINDNEIDATYTSNSYYEFSVTEFSSVLVEGKYALDISAAKILDAETESSVTNWLFENIVIDSTDPFVSITPPSYTNETEIDVTISFNDENINYIDLSGDMIANDYSYQIYNDPNGELWSKTTGEYSVTLSLTEGEGTKTITVDAADKAGNEMQSQATTILDQTPPEVGISINGLTEGYTDNTIIDVSCSCVDSSSGCLEEYIVYYKEENEESWSVLPESKDVGNVYDEEKSFVFKCSQLDNAGNKGESSEDTAIVDKKGPLACIDVEGEYACSIGIQSDDKESILSRISSFV